MSIQNSIDRIIAAVTKAHQAVEVMGGSTTAPYLIENLEEAVKSIPKGEDLSAELEAQDALISALEDAVAGKAAGGGTAEPPNIQPLTVTENGTYTASGDVDGYSPIEVNVPTTGSAIETCDLTISLENAPSAYILYIFFESNENGILKTTVNYGAIYNGNSTIVRAAVGTPVNIHYFGGSNLISADNAVNADIVYEDFGNFVVVKCKEAGTASVRLLGYPF